jgi:hypothetical protein
MRVPLIWFLALLASWLASGLLHIEIIAMILLR